MADKFIFFDRDGTLIEEVNFLSTVEETRLFPFTVEALTLLRDAGYRFVVTTNQSGIARGYFEDSAVIRIHERMNELIEPQGLLLEQVRFCPHMPDAGCRCRKPGTGMIEDALDGNSVDLSECWVIGDKLLDVGMGFNAGTRTALVLTGYGAVHVDQLERDPDIVADNLLEAAKMIVAADNWLRVR